MEPTTNLLSAFYEILALMSLPILISLLAPRISLLFNAILSLFLFILSCCLMAEGLTHRVEIKFLTSFKILKFNYGLDELSLFFIGLIGFVSIAVSIYSFSYIKHIEHKILFAIIYNLFTVSMLFVVLSKNIFSFLLFWELMSVSSFFLVLFDYKKEENIQASILYLVMTHIGTAFIIISFGIMYYFSGSFSFYNWHNIALNNTWEYIVFLLALIGFGTKAGIFPLHIWLPKAHPVAPSNISAMMSGLMLKIAIYMLIQYFFVFLREYPISYGFIVLIIGSITALYGILYGFVNSDIKKLLAYSSMENIGIIMIAIGIAMIFKSYGIMLLAGIGLLAALYHILNHAIFKSLLFMSSGVILLKTKTKNMDKLGGLIKFMPTTAIFTLIGILGIVALPPFNGFVSEWLIYQSLLFGGNINNTIVAIFIPIIASVLALTSSFSLATFVKMFGVSFLGKSRTLLHEDLKDADKFALFGMGTMAFFVILLGVLPMIVVYFLSDVIKSILNINIYNNLISKYGLILTFTSYSYGRVSPLLLAFTGIFVFFFIYLVIRIVGNGRIRVYETWACGLTDMNTTPKAQYTGIAFSAPTRRIFSFLFHIKEFMHVEEKPKYFFPRKIYKIEIYDIIDVLYSKLTNFILNPILKLRIYIQSGIIHVYLLFIIITLIVLLMLIRV